MTKGGGGILEERGEGRREGEATIPEPKERRGGIPEERGEGEVRILEPKERGEGEATILKPEGRGEGRITIPKEREEQGRTSRVGEAKIRLKFESTGLFGTKMKGKVSLHVLATGLFSQPSVLPSSSSSLPYEGQRIISAPSPPKLPKWEIEGQLEISCTEFPEAGNFFREKKLKGEFVYGSSLSCTLTYLTDPQSPPESGSLLETLDKGFGWQLEEKGGEGEGKAEAEAEEERGARGGGEAEGGGGGVIAEILQSLSVSLSKVTIIKTAGFFFIQVDATLKVDPLPLPFSFGYSPSLSYGFLMYKPDRASENNAEAGVRVFPKLEELMKPFGIEKIGVTKFGLTRNRGKQQELLAAVPKMKGLLPEVLEGEGRGEGCELRVAVKLKFHPRQEIWKIFAPGSDTEISFSLSAERIVLALSEFNVGTLTFQNSEIGFTMEPAVSIYISTELSIPVKGKPWASLKGQITCGMSPPSIKGSLDLRSKQKGEMLSLGKVHQKLSSLYLSGLHASVGLSSGGLNLTLAGGFQIRLLGQEPLSIEAAISVAPEGLVMVYFCLENFSLSSLLALVSDDRVDQLRWLDDYLPKVEVCGCLVKTLASEVPKEAIPGLDIEANSPGSQLKQLLSESPLFNAGVVGTCGQAAWKFLGMKARIFWNVEAQGTEMWKSRTQFSAEFTPHCFKILGKEVLKISGANSEKDPLVVSFEFDPSKGKLNFLVNARIDLCLFGVALNAFVSFSNEDSQPVLVIDLDFEWKLLKLHVKGQLSIDFFRFPGTHKMLLPTAFRTNLALSSGDIALTVIQALTKVFSQGLECVTDCLLSASEYLTKHKSVRGLGVLFSGIDVVVKGAQFLVKKAKAGVDWLGGYLQSLKEPECLEICELRLGGGFGVSEGISVYLNIHVRIFGGTIKAGFMVSTKNLLSDLAKWLMKIILGWSDGITPSLPLALGKFFPAGKPPEESQVELTEPVVVERKLPPADIAKLQEKIRKAETVTRRIKHAQKIVWKERGNFKEDLPEQIFCPLTGTTLAFNLDACTFCGEKVPSDRLKRHLWHCPKAPKPKPKCCFCFKELDTSVLEHEKVCEIRGLKASCGRCGAKDLTIEELAKHLKTCQMADKEVCLKCGYPSRSPKCGQCRKEKCGTCEQKIMHRNMADHMEFECQDTCKFCYKKIASWDMREHLETDCPMVVLAPCPHCKQPILPNDNMTPEERKIDHITFSCESLRTCEVCCETYHITDSKLHSCEPATGCNASNCKKPVSQYIYKVLESKYFTKHNETLVESFPCPFGCDQPLYYTETFPIEHLENCHQFKQRCDFPECKQEYRPRDIKKHILNYCDGCHLPCAKCGKKMLPKNMHSHLQDCLGAKIISCAKCDQTLLFKDEIHHLNFECNNYKVHCTTCLKSPKKTAKKPMLKKNEVTHYQLYHPLIPHTYLPPVNGQNRTGIGFGQNISALVPSSLMLLAVEELRPLGYMKLIQGTMPQYERKDHVKCPKCYEVFPAAQKLEHFMLSSLVL
jgi:hypothetical protein